MNPKKIVGKIWREFVKLLIKPILYLNKQIKRTRWLKVRRHKNYRLFFIDHTRKLIYVENPKAASRSILATMGTAHLQGMSGILNSVPGISWAFTLPTIRGKMPHIYVLSKNGISHETRDWLRPKELEEYYKFTFVRNPFDRIVSGYTNKIISNTPIGVPQRLCENNWGKFLGDDVDEKDNPKSFKNFLEKYIKEYEDDTINIHFKQQEIMLENHGKENFLDFVGKIENFDEDWNKVAIKFNLPKRDMAHLNKSDKRKSYDSYYPDKESVDIVYNRYKNDIDRYGYQEYYKKLIQKFEK